MLMTEELAPEVSSHLALIKRPPPSGNSIPRPRNAQLGVKEEEKQLTAAVPATFSSFESISPCAARGSLGTSCCCCNCAGTDSPETNYAGPDAFLFLSGDEEAINSSKVAAALHHLPPQRCAIAAGSADLRKKKESARNN